MPSTEHRRDLGRLWTSRARPFRPPPHSLSQPALRRPRQAPLPPPQFSALPRLPATGSRRPWLRGRVGDPSCRDHRPTSIPEAGSGAAGPAGETLAMSEHPPPPPLPFTTATLCDLGPWMRGRGPLPTAAGRVSSPPVGGLPPPHDPLEIAAVSFESQALVDADAWGIVLGNIQGNSLDGVLQGTTNDGSSDGLSESP